MSILKSAFPKIFGTSDYDFNGLVDGFWSGVNPGYGRRTSAGEHVSPERSLTLSAYWACVRNISEDLAELPFSVFERGENDSVNEQIAHPVRKLLSIRPNYEMSSMSFRETMTHYALSWGNGIAEIERDNAGRPIALWPIHPSRVYVVRVNNVVTYRIMVGDIMNVQFSAAEPNKTIELHQEDVFHLHGISGVGIMGYSVARLAAESIGVALAAQTYGATFFGNGARPSVLLSHPKTLNDIARKNIRESWNDMYQGAHKSNKVGILEEGLKVETLSIPPEEAQFLETRQFQVEEICRWFRMPPHKIQHLLRSTLSNIEAQNIEYADTLTPWAKRWEQEADWKLFSENEQARLFTSHDFKELMRGDAMSRATYYNLQLQCGAMSPNDIRRAENRNPIPNGDTYLMQLNMTTLEKIQKPDPEPQAVPPAKQPFEGMEPKKPKKKGETE